LDEFFSILLGLVGGLCLGQFGGRGAPKLVDALRWARPRPSRSDLAFALISGVAVGLIAWLSVGLLEFGLAGMRGLGLAIVLGVWLMMMLKLLDKGFAAVEVNMRAAPNDGTWRSGRNSLVFGLASGLVFGLVLGLVFGLFFGLGRGPDGKLSFDLEFGLGFGLVFGVLGALGIGLAVALSKGARFFLQHWGMRLVLRLKGYAPFQYVRFLDYAAERFFLRKLGGGYIFVHRMLMEYFASLE
jgi:hypothetical protein